ncbi:MAG TPA: pyridoxamine 5'-phosphate oxidase family protein [Mycobacteriales bacterium]|nr:pyridoxamine 5'-phosphate oxidase family protein [Mycobacteriales bacterium]
MLQTETGVRELSRQECLSLLPTVPVGRVVFTDRALPAIVPVNFVVDAAGIVIRTGAGSTLAAAVRGSVVAFEVDEVDRDARNGWCVTVTGQARQVTDPLELERLGRLDLTPWAGGDRHHVVVVPIDLVSGRRVGSGPLPLTR